MSQNRIFTRLLLVVSITLSSLGFSQTIGPWNLNNLYAVPTWEVTPLAPKSGVTSILYKSMDYLGNPVKVFAYYSAPSGTMPIGGWPAVVYAHGGGGTASSSWVKSLNEHGYAAISMDLEGHYPIKDANGKYFSSPNPGPSRNGNWNDWQLKIHEQWYYHAVSQIILAHSLLSSFKEVNANKTGIIGISWGGLLTSTTMGIDNRFKFAIPVYGAGYVTEADSYMGISNADKEAFVRNNYDGRTYFKNVKCPTFWINGTNDAHFPMTMTNQSSDVMKVPSKIRYEVKMSHGENTPRQLNEVYKFADYVLKNGDPLVTFGKPKVNGKTASVAYKSPSKISSAQLCYTLDNGTWNVRNWNTTSATVLGNTISANIPTGATAIYFNVTDSRNLMTTTEYIQPKNAP